MSNHASRAHALLSASSAHRWLKCTLAPHLEDTQPSVDTIYSRQGTKAHELAEEMLRAYLIEKDPIKAKWVYAEGLKDDKDMAEVKTYVEAILELAPGDDPYIGLEITLDLSEWAPESFGTADVLMIAGDHLQVCDLKYGQGERVEAQDNPQLKLYGLGALALVSAIYDIKTVSMTIVQPRLSHQDTMQLSADELLEWGESIKPTAKMAHQGKGNLTPGHHCRFCKVRAICPARKELYMNLIPTTVADVALLTNEQIAELLPHVEQVEQFIKDIKAKAISMLLAGQEVPGFKVVEGRSNRKVADEQGLVAAMTANGIPEASIYSRKLETLTNLEKLAGGKKAFTAKYEQFVTKPQGAPTLVPISDKRPQLLSQTTAEEDFADIL